MEDQNKEELYPGNSYSVQKQPLTKRSESEKKERRQKPIAQAKEKKRTFGQKFADRFLSITKDEIQNRLIDEWLFPGICNAIEDLVHFILFQDRIRPGSRRDRDDGRMRRIDYNGRYDESRREPYLNRRTRQPELVFDTRDEANEVLETLYEYLDDYRKVTVKDLYTLADMPTDFTMTNWGWYDLSDAIVLRCDEGFLLRMPKIQEIRR